MRIWIWESAGKGYESFSVVGADEKYQGSLQGSFSGEPMRDRWEDSLLVETAETGKPSDTPLCFYGGGGPVVSPPALEALKDFLEGNAEILPLQHLDGRTFYAVNVTRLLDDAVDQEKAEAKRFSSGLFWRYEKIAFHPETVRNEHIFKLHETRSTCVYVSDAFKERVDSSGLEGFVFKEAWDSEKA